jgi:hypothetical protein
MSTGQTMLSVAFFVLLTVAVLNANRLILSQDETYYTQEALEQGTTFANSLLTEILTKKFDSTVDTTSSYYMYPWEFDWAMGAGAAAVAYVNPGTPRTPDVFPFKSIRGTYRVVVGDVFDDVDDYHDYVRTANTSEISGYLLTVSVYYVNKATPDVHASIQTYFKRVDVTVTHPIYIKRPITFSAIASYN